jgi:hypothetical protein
VTRLLTTFAAIAMLFFGASAVARAQDAVPAEVLIVLASDAAGAIDPRLAEVPALRQPPFDSYRSMMLLSSPRISLRPGQPQEVRLPNGRRVRIVLREVTPEGRFRLQISINRPGQQDYLPELNVVASPGDPFFVAGQSYREGTLVIGFRLGQRRR